MGGGTRSYEMAKRLAYAGYNVTVVTSQTTSKPYAGSEINDFEVVWIPVKYGNDMSYARRILAFLIFSVRSLRASFRLTPDLVFASSTPLTICLPALVIQWKRGIPFVFEVRDLWPKIPIAIGAISNPALVRLSLLLERFAYKNADRIITLSSGMTEGVLEVEPFPEKITEIPNSCDLDTFYPDDTKAETLREKFSWLANRPMLLYAGALGKVNGVRWLVEIAAKLIDIEPNICIVIIGQGLERKDIKDLAVEKNVLGKNFFMLEKVPKSEISAWLQAATASCSTIIPLKELESNCANKFFDTLASGKPIIINHEGWQKELIEKENIGVSLNYRDTFASAHALRLLLLDGARCRLLGNNARKLAENRYSRDECGARLVKVFDELLDRTRASPFASR